MDQDRLADLAAAIADLTPIDWDTLEADIVDAAGRTALHRLRFVETIVRASAAFAPGGNPSSADPPQVWGPFTVFESVGRGTFGDVYRAHDRRLDRVVALKLLRPEGDSDRGISSEVIDEARLLAKVRHQNVVTVYGAERIDGRVGLWMEFVDGRTLEQELRTSGPLPPASVAAIGIALCDALLAVHGAGLLHRDLKAQNVMRAADGRLLLTDFGAGRLLESAAAPHDVPLAGTPLYLAPEILSGQPPTIAGEIYSLGVLLYHLSTGSFPVQGRTLRELREAHTLDRRIRLQAHLRTSLAALVPVVDRAIDPDPKKRFGTVEEMQGALRRAASPRRVAARLAMAILGFLLCGASANLIWDRWFPLRIIAQSEMDTASGAAGAGILFAAGNRLYFESDLRQWSIPQDGSAPRKLENDRTDRFVLLDRHPQHVEYLARKASLRDDLLLVSDSRGSRSLKEARCEAATFSPDGHRIACGNRSQLFVLDGDGSVIREVILPSVGAVGAPRWSPDGQRLRFSLKFSDGGTTQSTSLWEARADGTGLRELIKGWNDRPAEGSGTWTPDGRNYIFPSTQNGKTDLWALADIRGMFDWRAREPRRLTDSSSSWPGTIAVSSDGGTIYATASKAGTELVRVVNAGRSWMRFLDGLSATWVSYSSDRRRMAYLSFPEHQLWTASADGRSRRQIVAAPVALDGAIWSPDDAWISFNASFEGVHKKIFLVRPDGSELHAVVEGDVEQGIASWSRNGTQFCFGDVSKTFGIPDGHERLHIYDLATRNVSSVPGSERMQTCRWSPNGRYLAAVRIDLDPASRMVLHIFDTHDNSWRALPLADHVNNPTWTSDSKFIVYDTEGGSFRLRRVRISDFAVEEWNIPGLTLATQWSGLTAENEPLLLRGTDWTRVYALKLGRW